MKRLSKKLLSATLALLMLVSVFASMPLTASAADNLNSASTWARENITSALAKGFIPADIQSDYTAPITRQEFCRMAVNFVEYYAGKSIDAVMADKGVARQQNAFSDTNDQDILAAYALGITSGTVAPTATAPGKFDPDAQFNREQAATMLQRVCRVVGMNTSAVTDQGYTDISSASSWAVEAINYCYANKIMTGTSTTPLTFSPKDTYSREQSIITFDRIVKGDTVTEPGIMRNISAAELVADMGMLNTNHARAVDRIDYDYKIGYANDPNPNDQYSKVAWITLWTDGVTASIPNEFAGDDRWSGKGSPLIGFGEFYTLEKFSQVIKEFKNVGYKAVRLPVSWTYWANSTTHEIDEEWMDLVEACVGIILDNGLYCIINPHEDYMGQSWVGDHWAENWMSEQYKEYVNTRYVAIWRQIAENFRDYGDYLIFESLNEPHDRNREQTSYDKVLENGINRINEMQDLFVKTVRGTGGNNAQRFLSLTHWMSIADHAGRNMLDTIKLPQDKNIIVQTHYYYYDNEQIATSWNRGDISDKKAIDTNFEYIKQFMDKTGVPVILGEFGNNSKLPLRDRIDQATYILEKASDLGVPAFWWECTADSPWDKQNGNDFSLYNRDKMEWEYPEILNAIMGIANNSNSVPNPPAGNTTVDKSFNSAAQSYLNGLSAEAKEGIKWTRKSYDGIEFIEAYRDDSQKKPLLFFLHGGGGSKEQVMGDIDRYAHEGFYAVALDVAGCGDSQIGPIMAYKAFEVTVGYIDSLIDYYKTVAQADADTFAVGGGSMGGSISFCYAAHGKYKPKVILPDAGTPDLLLNSDGPMYDCFDKGKSGQPRTMTDAELRAFAAEYSPINTPENFLGIAIYARNGSRDTVTPPTGSRNLEEELKRLGHTDIVFNYYDVGHEAYPNDNGAGLRFLKEHRGMS